MNVTLDNLVYIYSVDTSSFYNDEENNLNKKLTEFRNYKSLQNEILKPINNFILNANKILKSGKKEMDDLEKELLKYINENTFKNELTNYILFDKKNNKYVINKNSTFYINNQYLNFNITYIERKLDELADNFKGRRKLREDSLVDSNKISLFESTLTRSLDLQNGEISKEIIVVRAYRYVIFEKIIKEGFVYNGERYEYFSSSAGQIRNKKSCFIKSKSLNKNKHYIRNKLMCGLSVGKINRLGGINQNKYQAYLSLTNSASKKWTDFNIDNAIVVDDMELTVNSIVDNIDHESYKVERMSKDVTINFIDGAGMIMPTLKDKAFQFRANWFKGLLIPFDFISFIDAYCNGCCTVKDIYGKEWDIKKDNISIIFTKSQFKLHKFYSSWDEYKDHFKKYDCEASICKIEESDFEDKPINYQMLQTLNFNKEELTELASSTIDDIELIGKDKDTMLKLLGADTINEKMNYLQKSLNTYPEMLNDEYSKKNIKNRKKSLVNDAKSGKILIPNTKRTYISPDVYAFAEWLFLKRDYPKGLLNNGEVSCKLYDNEKLDILRSPHLFREHCVRTNVRNQDTDRWYVTNCIYTSVHDLISKQLMFDVDGDDALIVNNELFITRAEEEMKDIVPLDYELATAKKSKLTMDNTVNSLKAAYSKNIGEISNLITKIWNSEEVDINLIKILCMENNAVIDYAKCLWMPTRPEHIKNKIKVYADKKLPYFFKYAKDKSENQTEELIDDESSTVNKLDEVIPDKRINFAKVVGKFDYKNLMRNKRTKTDTKLAIELIEKYNELDKYKHNIVKQQLSKQSNSTNTSELNIYKEIRKELLKITKDKYKTVDILVRYLYFEKKSVFKDTLWRSFGKELHENINLNILSIKLCMNCKTAIDALNSKKYCLDCAKEKEKQRKRLNWKLKNTKTSENEQL